MSNDPNEKVLGDNAGVYIPQDNDNGSVRIDFGGFIVGLYQSAMMSLGKMPTPEGHEMPVDIDAAKHTIDILRMLSSKTKGNLDTEEERLLNGLLYELKVAFVEASR